MPNKKFLALFVFVILTVSPLIASSTVSLANNTSNNEFVVDRSLVNSGEHLFIVWFDGPAKPIKTESLGLKFVGAFKYVPVQLLYGELTWDKVEQLKKMGVKGIYPNLRYRLPKYYVINDDIEPKSDSSTKTIGAPYVWDQGYNGTDVVIAIIDTGIDKTHPDLQGKVIAEKSFVSTQYGYDENDPTTDDYIGHGTMVSGVAAGKGTGSGRGVAPGAKLVNAKVFQTAGGNEIATTAGIIAAINWVVGLNVDVINLSLGGGNSRFDVMPRIVDYVIRNYGIIFAIAAGNSGSNGTFTMSVGSPGIATLAITAAAATPVGVDAIGTFDAERYSSIGPAPGMYVKPDVSAPGNVGTTKAGGGYAYVAGTSFASPHVAGSAALFVQILESMGVNRGDMPGIIKALFMNTANPVRGYDELWVGAGALNLTRAYITLQTLSKVNGVPYVSAILPTHLPVAAENGKPYFPYAEKLFIGQHVEVNISITTSVDESFTITLEGNITNALVFTSTSFNIEAPGGLYELVLQVSENATVGYYEGIIKLESTNTVKEIPIAFEVEEPVAFMAFDMKHTDWQVDYKYGQFKNFFIYAENHSIAVEHIYYDQEFNLDLLKRYDIVYMPDAASMYSKMGPQGEDLGYGYINITQDEINAIHEYITRYNGFVILIGMDPEGNDMGQLNSLAGLFDVKFGLVKLVVNKNVDTAVGDPNCPIAVDELPFYGVETKILGDKAMPVLKYNNKVVMALSLSLGGGILFSGTNFIFDNWAFNDEYIVPAHYVYEFMDKLFDLMLRKNYPWVSVPENITVNQETTITVYNGVSGGQLDLKITSEDGETLLTQTFNLNDGVNNFNITISDYTGNVTVQAIITWNSYTFNRIGVTSVVEAETTGAGGVGGVTGIDPMLIAGIVVAIVVIVAVAFIFLRKKG